MEARLGSRPSPGQRIDAECVGRSIRSAAASGAVVSRAERVRRGRPSGAACELGPDAPACGGSVCGVPCDSADDEEGETGITMIASCGGVQ